MQIEENLINIFNNLKQQRAGMEGIWRDVNKYVKPQKNYFLNSSSYEGTKDVFDSSAMLASDHLASFVWSLVNSSSLKWFNFSLKQDKPSKEHNAWADNVTKIVLNSLLSPEVGFYHKSFELYSDLVNYGTAVFYSGYNFVDKTVLLKTIPLKDCYVLKSESEHTAGVVRRICLSKSEFNKLFPNYSRYVAEGDFNNVNVLHIVIKADLIKDNKNLAIGKKWSSFYVLENKAKLIAHDGYGLCPYTVLRWSTSSQSVYGDSPAILALPDIKTLNAIAKSIIVSTQRQIDPPILVANESNIKGAKIAPGSLIKGGLSSVTGDSLIKALSFDVKSENIFNFYEQKKQTVLDAFYNPTIVNNLQNKQMTATEVDINKEQQLSILGPKIARIQSEFLYPLLKRKYEIMKNLGQIPSLKGKVPNVDEVSVNFKGLWSKYQKISDVKNINSALKTLSLVKEISQEGLEDIDWKAFTRNIIESYGISYRKQ